MPVAVLAGIALSLTACGNPAPTFVRSAPLQLTDLKQPCQVHLQAVGPVSTRVPSSWASFGNVPPLCVTDDLATYVPVTVAFSYAGQPLADDAASGIASFGSQTDYAGNHGIFNVRVQEFVDCIAAPPNETQPATGGGSHTLCGPGGGPHGEPVLAGPDGSNGFWEDVSLSLGNADLFSGSQDLQIPTHLLDVAQYVRVEAHVALGDTRLGPGPVSWAPGSDVLYCANGAHPHFVAGHGEVCGTTVVHSNHGTTTVYVQARLHQAQRQSGSLQRVVDSQAFTVQVLPQAIVKLAAVPYAIQYVPPGNGSSAKLLHAVTEGTQYQVGTSASSSNSAADIKGTCQSTQEGFSESVFGVGGGLSMSQLACQTTTNVTGSAQSSSTADGDFSSQSVGAGWETHGDSGYVPGSYNKSAFWADTFVLDLGQPYSVYDDNGVSLARFLPLAGGPDWGRITVADLAACEAGTTLPDETDINAGVTTNGASFKDVCQPGYSVPDGKPVLLTATQAQSLLGLDPFWSGGQRSLLRAPRFTPLSDTLFGSETCGRGYGKCEPFIQNTWGSTSGQSFAASTVTGVAVADTNASTEGWNLCLTPKISGVGGGPCNSGATSNSQGTVNATGAGVGYFGSTTVSHGQQVTFQDTIDDSAYPLQITTAPPATPQCNNNPIFLVPSQDNVFAGLALRDPCAAVPWWWNIRSPMTVPQLRQAVTQMVRENPQITVAIRSTWAARPVVPGAAATGP